MVLTSFCLDFFCDLSSFFLFLFVDFSDAVSFGPDFVRDLDFFDDFDVVDVFESVSDKSFLFDCLLGADDSEFFGCFPVQLSLSFSKNESSRCAWNFDELSVFEGEPSSDMSDTNFSGLLKAFLRLSTSARTSFEASDVFDPDADPEALGCICLPNTSRIRSFIAASISEGDRDVLDGFFFPFFTFFASGAT